MAARERTGDRGDPRNTGGRPRPLLTGGRRGTRTGRDVGPRTRSGAGGGAAPDPGGDRRRARPGGCHPVRDRRPLPDATATGAARPGAPVATAQATQAARAARASRTSRAGAASGPVTGPFGPRFAAAPARPAGRAAGRAAVARRGGAHHTRTGGARTGAARRGASPGPRGGRHHPLVPARDGTPRSNRDTPHDPDAGDDDPGRARRGHAAAPFAVHRRPAGTRLNHVTAVRTPRGPHSSRSALRAPSVHLSPPTPPETPCPNG